MRLNKDQIENICRRANMKPEARKAYKDYDIFVSDGFLMPPHPDYWDRFGLERMDYPGGAYATFWWLMRGEDKMLMAMPLFFEAAHNPEWDAETKKQARINKALQTAEHYVDRLRFHARNLH